MSQEMREMLTGILSAIGKSMDDLKELRKSSGETWLLEINGSEVTIGPGRNVSAAIARPTNIRLTVSESVVIEGEI